MHVLLHACCGPCSLEPVSLLLEEKINFALDYTNPNITPLQEYQRRLATLRSYVSEPNKLCCYTGEYDPETWEAKAGIWGLRREMRCRMCYRIRFERVAKRAALQGFDTIATTLTVSPYQFTQIIFEELERAAQIWHLKALCRDFSPYYRAATQLSRELGMYRQNYCGCRFSVAEAEATRKRLRQERKARKAAKKEANSAKQTQNARLQCEAKAG